MKTFKMNENNKYTEIIVVEYTLKSRPTAEETSREIGLWRFKGFYFFLIFLFLIIKFTYLKI